MPLSKEDVAAIAEYARFHLTDKELDEMTVYMNEAIRLLQPIREYDLEGVKPTYQPIGDLSNVMREDVVDDHDRALDLKDAMHNAGSTHDRYFRVPSILGDEEEA